LTEQQELLKRNLIFGERLQLEKVPFDFRLRWRDAAGDERDSLVLSWELYQMWRAYRKKYERPVNVMREKLMSDVFGSDRQLSLFMGNHSRRRNTRMVCGWFAPAKELASHESLF
jgi:hypothetical protein